MIRTLGVENIIVVHPLRAPMTPRVVVLDFINGQGQGHGGHITRVT